MSAEQQRMVKWAGREAEWTRLADLATDSHISDVCRDLATQAASMATFWSDLHERKVS